MIDKDFIEQKIKLIKEDLKELQDIKPHHWEVFLEDKRCRYISEHLLEHIINRAIDINNHIVVESKKAPPDGYEQSFLALAELGILSGNFAAAISKSAGLRNRITHDYDDIKYDIFYESINDCLQQYPEYIKNIITFLDRVKS